LQHPLAPHTRVPESDATARRVIVADDDPIGRLVASEVLRRLGLHVTEASDGRAAVDAFCSGAADLVFLDCCMPVMDGYAAAAEIRRLETAGEHVPIVALTGKASANDRQRCLDAGMDDVLTKPFALPVLRETLARWLDSPER